MPSVFRAIKNAASARLERVGRPEQQRRFPITCTLLGLYEVHLGEIDSGLCELCVYFIRTILNKSHRSSTLPDGFVWEISNGPPSLVYPAFNHYSSRKTLADYVASGCPLCTVISHELRREHLTLDEPASTADDEDVDDTQILLIFRESSAQPGPGLSFLDERLWTFSIVDRRIFREDRSPGRGMVKRHEVELAAAYSALDCLTLLPTFKSSWGTRKIPPLAPLSDDCRNQIKLWRKTCRENHPQCQRNGSGPDSPKFALPIRLLDIEAYFREGKLQGVRLIETSQLPPDHLPNIHYVALSYCWGGWQGLVTKRDNIEDLYDYVPEDLLPKTVRDAITVCRKLGVRYLWVDALCIRQDDADEWRLEAEHMADVYGGCEFALAASSSFHADEGFLSQRGFQPARLATAFDTSNPKKGGGKGIYIRRVPVDVSAQIKSSPLASRGWALQEWILAPAVLHFGSDQLMWECDSVCVESETGEESHSFPPVVRLSNRLGKHRFGFHSRPLWDAIVEEFTKRHLTKPADNVPAIAGLAKKLRALGVYSGNYVAGMWEDYLERQLLWHIDVVALSSLTGDTAVQSKQENHAIPSWSWAHWNRPARFPLTRNVRAQWNNAPPRFESVTTDPTQHLADTCILSLNLVTHRVDLSYILANYPPDHLGRISCEGLDGEVVVWLPDEMPAANASYFSVCICIQDWESVAAQDYIIYNLLVQKIDVAKESAATSKNPLLADLAEKGRLEDSWVARRVGLLTLSVSRDQAIEYSRDLYADLADRNGTPIMTEGRNVEMLLV